jgi:hypothetical protein
VLYQHNENDESVIREIIRCIRKTITYIVWYIQYMCINLNSWSIHICIFLFNNHITIHQQEALKSLRVTI